MDSACVLVTYENVIEMRVRIIEFPLYNENKEYDGAIDLYNRAEVLKDIYNCHIEFIEVTFTGIALVYYSIIAI